MMAITSSSLIMVYTTHFFLSVVGRGLQCCKTLKNYFISRENLRSVVMVPLQKKSQLSVPISGVYSDGVFSSLSFFSAVCWQ